MPFDGDESFSGGAGPRPRRELPPLRLNLSPEWRFAVAIVTVLIVMLYLFPFLLLGVGLVRYGVVSRDEVVFVVAPLALACMWLIRWAMGLGRRP